MPTAELDVKQIGARVATASEPFRQLLVQMHRVIVGQDELLHRMLVAVLSRGHVLIEAYPGWRRQWPFPAWHGASTRVFSDFSSRPTFCRRT